MLVIVPHPSRQSFVEMLVVLIIVPMHVSMFGRSVLMAVPMPFRMHEPQR